MTTSRLPSKSPATCTLQTRFLSLLPRLEQHGQVYFRGLKCAQRKEEALAEMVALAWKWFLRLARQGKDASEFFSALAAYAARAVKCGRRLCGQERARDALSARAQRRHGFAVNSLPAGSTLHGNVFDEALRDNTQTPPDEQVAFRLDFPAWRLRRCERDRRLIDDLMSGERPLDAARQHGLSPGRISQLRREFCSDWQAFCGGPNA